MTQRPVVRAVLLDVEGTLFAKGRALPDAATAVASLRERGLGVRFLTNIDHVLVGDCRDVLDYPLLDNAFRALRADGRCHDGHCGGREAGARTVQVRTGKYADQQAEGIPSSADATIDSVADLRALLAHDL